jgi:hypothetical protein
VDNLLGNNNITTDMYEYLHVLPSVRLFVWVPLTVDGFQRKLVLRSYAETCRENSKVVIIDQALDMKT